MDTMDNILIHQKDYIILLIDSGRIDEAKIVLDLLIELWTEYNYMYKHKELLERMYRHDCV